MGLHIGFSHSSFDRRNEGWVAPVAVPFKQPKQVNPDPSNYVILDSYEVNKNVLIKLKYLDCTNYEGVKILLYENCRLLDLMNQKLLDPHFSDNEQLYSPFARFEPTKKGWEQGVKLACSLNQPCLHR